MWIAVAIWLASVLSADEVLGPVGVALGVVDLDRPEQVVAEPDRMDDQAPHLRSIGGTIRGSRRASLTVTGSPDVDRLARGTAPQLAGRLPAVGAPERAAIGQRASAPSTTR